MPQWREREITSENIDEVLCFCSKYEEKCINLVQHLREEAKNLKGRFSLLYLAKRKIPLAKVFYLNEKIDAVACINRHQFLLYCIDNDLAEEHVLELCHLMTKAFPISKIYALMGEEEVQTKLKELLLTKNKIKPTYVMHYILMIFDPMTLDYVFSAQYGERAVFAKQKITNKGHTSNSNAINHILTRQATLADTSLLLPLQSEYEKEEVCIKGNPFPPYVSMMNLQKILNNEIAYITLLDKNPIAKANTNAKGINWVQLGGVYTLAKYRRCGIGQLTVASLMEHIFKREKKKIALFVNIENTAAIAMYKNLNFVDAGRLMISYFR